MTATWAGHTVPDDMWNAIIGGAYGNPAHQQIPPALLCAMAWCETDFQNIQSTNYGTPNTPGYGADGRELSFSYWQLNLDGIGHGYEPEQLLNPSTSAFLTRNELLHRLATGSRLSSAGLAWSTWGQAWALYLAYPLVEISGF